MKLGVGLGDGYTLLQQVRVGVRVRVKVRTRVRVRVAAWRLPGLGVITREQYLQQHGGRLRVEEGHESLALVVLDAHRLHRAEDAHLHTCEHMRHAHACMRCGCVRERCACGAGAVHMCLHMQGKALELTSLTSSS